MYQRKVDVDMLNAVKSVLAIISSVSPSSEKALCSYILSLYAVSSISTTTLRWYIVRLIPTRLCFQLLAVNYSQPSPSPLTMWVFSVGVPFPSICAATLASRWLDNQSKMILTSSRCRAAFRRSCGCIEWSLPPEKQRPGETNVPVNKWLPCNQSLLNKHHWLSWTSLSMNVLFTPQLGN